VLVKYQGGPLKGQYQEVQTSWSDRIQVQGIDPVTIKDRARFYEDPYAPIEFKRGEYARSNKTLKNGATIYIWMGWVE